MTTRPRTFRAVMLVVAMAIALVAPAAVAQETSAPTDLLISEYVEGTSNNKALEFYNGTDAAISLDGYRVEISFNGSTSVGNTIALVGEVVPGDVFVMADDDAAVGGAVDQLAGGNFYNGDDLIVLRNAAGEVVDSIGQLGVDPGSAYGTGDLTTQNHTLRRAAGICAGDTDLTDAFDPADEWVGHPVDTFDGLGSHTADCGGGGGGGDAGVVLNEFSASTTGTDVEYLEVFGEPDTDYSNLTILQVEGDSNSSARGTAITSHAVGTTDGDGIWSVDLAANTLQNGTLTLLLVQDWDGTTVLDADQDGTVDATGFGEVVDAVAVHDDGAGDLTYGVALRPDYDGLGSFAPGGASRIPDGVDTDTTTDWVRNDFDLAGIDGTPGTPDAGEAYNTPGAPNEAVDGGGGTGGECGDPTVTVASIQGSGDTTPVPGQAVEIEGVVVGDFQDGDDVDGDLDGFHVQGTGDGDAATSDGIFVYDGRNAAVDVAVGDVVHVVGTAEEYTTTDASQTQVRATGVVVCDSGVALPDPVEVTLPMTDAQWEALEGMYVTFPQDLAILEYFNYDRFGELALGTDRQYQPTARYEPGSDEAIALAMANALNRITLDDGLSTQNPDVTRHPNGEPFSLDNRFRGGDLVTDATGVIDQTFGLYRIQPTRGAAVTVANPRPDVPEVGGTMTVASFNVLNYFTSIDDGTNVCPAPEVGPDAGCRGADTPEELERQQAKIVAALAALDADVVGLIEIQNDDASVATLVDALNAELGGEVYDYVPTGPIGTDAIKVALVYKPSTVTPTGDHAILDQDVDPRFLDDKNRPALAQTFVEDATGAAVTVAVNHLKSKGSSCDDVGDPEDPDGQGNCNQVRVDAAAALVDWMAADPTGTGTDGGLIIGDLNSYDQEDPIDVLVDAGWTDLLAQYGGEDAYSYVFDGQLGYLDYALASPALVDEVTGAAAWHANADEPDLLDYDTSFKSDGQAAIFAPDPYRASDHDAVVVGLALDEPQPEYPAWDATVRYQPGDVVSHDGLTWEATRPNRNKEPGAQQNGPWRLFGVDYTLTVLHNNDGESDLLGDDDGAGSISRFAWLVRELQRDAGRQSRTTGVPSGVVTISAGDNFLASPEWQASLDRGVPYYDAMALDRIGYDAFTIGNHEFDFGPEVLANFIESFRGNDDIFLSANLDFSQVPSLQALVDAGRIRPSLVVEERGERIGIVGATTPELREVTSPGDVVVDDDLVGVIQAEVDELTADGVDKVLLSSHLQDIDNELALVTGLRDVDAVIGGGGGEDIAGNYPLVATDAEGVSVPVVTVPGDYFDVGRLELYFDDEGEVVAWGGGLVPVTGEVREDPYVRRRIEQPVENFLSDLADTVVATSQVGLNGVRADVRTRETNVGNLLADGLLATGAAQADEYGVATPQVALQNGGGIRNDSIIGPGSISLLDTFDIAPFTNFVAVVPDVSAADLVAAVEHGLAGLPGAAGSFGQWAGLTVTYDESAPAGARVVDLVLDDGTVLVEDATLVSDATVTVATIDFLAQGNDGYDMFAAYDFTRVGVSYQQSLADLLRGLGTVTSADYADPVQPGDRTRIVPQP